MGISSAVLLRHRAQQVPDRRINWRVTIWKVTHIPRERRRLGGFPGGSSGGDLGGGGGRRGGAGDWGRGDIKGPFGPKRA